MSNESNTPTSFTTKWTKTLTAVASTLRLHNPSSVKPKSGELCQPRSNIDQIRSTLESLLGGSNGDSSDVGTHRSHPQTRTARPCILRLPWSSATENTYPPESPSESAFKGTLLSLSLSATSSRPTSSSRSSPSGVKSPFAQLSTASDRWIADEPGLISFLPKIKLTRQVSSGKTMGVFKPRLGRFLQARIGYMLDISFILDFLGSLYLHDQPGGGTFTFRVFKSPDRTNPEPVIQLSGRTRETILPISGYECWGSQIRSLYQFFNPVDPEGRCDLIFPWDYFLSYPLVDVEPRHQLSESNRPQVLQVLEYYPNGALFRIGSDFRGEREVEESRGLIEHRKKKAGEAVRFAGWYAKCPK